MKLKSLVILFLFIFFPLFIFPSLSVEVSKFSFTQDEKEKIEIPEQYEGMTFLKNLNIEDDDGEMVIRYISDVDSSVDYSANKFYAADYFYLGANSATPGTSALVRIKKNLGATVSQNSLEIIPLASATSYLNGISENNTAVKKTNPIYDKQIDKMTLQGSKPVVTLQDASAVDGTAFGAQKLVCLIDNLNDGSSVKTNDVEIMDASGTNATAGIVGLESSSTKIFAAVKSNADSFGDGNGGFAVLNQQNSKLVPVDATTGTEGNKAFKLDITADELFAITQNAHGDVDLGDMYWDASLGRLFIGLSDAKRSNTGVDGGAISVLVGRLDGNLLTIEPILTLNSALFTDNSTNHIIGFNSTNVTALASSAYKLRTMKTSTSKKYLIVNGKTNIADVNNSIYAFPILGATKSDGTSVAVADVGKIADKNNKDIIVQNNTGMHLGNDVAALVGGGVLPIPTTKSVKDVFVVNDSVFVSVAETRDATNEAGIFRSTAILDENGYVRAWSPWQRVMGSADKVYGSGFDLNSGSFWYLTETAGNINTAKVTQWGKGSSNAGLMGNGLVDLLSNDFSQENGGVSNIINFDEDTPSIAKNLAAAKISFMTVFGNEKISFVQTGDGTNNNSDSINPTQTAFTENINVYTIEDDILKDFGPISSVELSNIADNNLGYLLVGGYNGLAILRNGTTGNGWDGQVGTAVINLATIKALFSFKELTDVDDSSFEGTRKVLCEGNSKFAYIMTLDKIYRFGITVDKMKDTLADALSEKTITTPPGYLLDMMIFYRAAGDTRLLVGTTQGLFYSDAINDTDENKTPVWTQITLNSGSALSKPVSHLSFIDTQKGGYTTNGNLYALATDFSLNLASIYRFTVQDGVVKAIKESSGTDYFYSVGEYRNSFFTDGALGYTALSKHLGNTNFLKQINMVSGQQSVRYSDKNIDLDLDSDAFNIGGLFMNSSSGGLVTPGDWGIRVNE